MELLLSVGTVEEKHCLGNYSRKLESPSACSILFILTLDFRLCIKETTDYFLELSCKLIGEHSKTVLILRGTICSCLEFRAHNERLMLERRTHVTDSVSSLSVTSTLSILVTHQSDTSCGICPLIHTNRSLF